MSDRLHIITVRGRIALAFCFLAIVVVTMLDGMGVAHYRLEMENFDRSIGDRVCLVLTWMLLACLFVWAAAEFRVRQSVLFQEAGGGRVLPLAVGIAGLLVLFRASARLIRIPLSGEAFGPIDGWQFGAGWILVWWGWVFRK